MRHCDATLPGQNAGCGPSFEGPTDEGPADERSAPPSFTGSLQLHRNDLLFVHKRLLDPGRVDLRLGEGGVPEDLFLQRDRGLDAVDLELG